MENQSNIPLTEAQKAERIKKRKESQKFLKVYMFSFFAVVITLISLSYFAQEKLNNQIEQLTIEANSNRQEALTHANSAENLQKYLDEQEKIIKNQASELEELQNQLEEYEKNNSSLSQEITFYQKFLEIEQYYSVQNYPECATLIVEFLENTDFDNPESIDIGMSANIIYRTHEMINAILENEEILQQLTAEQIDELKNLQNEG